MPRPASASANAAVIYEFFNLDSGTVTGFFVFKDSVASPTSGWSVPAGGSILDIIEGGLDGIVGDPGLGFGPAVGGDMTILTEFGSTTGAQLDMGSFGNGVLTFQGGQSISGYTFAVFPDVDTVTVGTTNVVPGHFTYVPVPAALPLLLSAIGVLGFVRRRVAGSAS